MKQESTSWLRTIRSSAFELMKDSNEQERKINIEDLGDHCTIQISIRVIRAEFQNKLEKLNIITPGQE